MTENSHMRTIEDVLEWRTLGGGGAERGKRFLSNCAVFDAEIAQQLSEILRQNKMITGF